MPPEPHERSPSEPDPQDQRDRELVARAQQGDQQALADWLERTQDRIFGVAYRMVGSREAAADITQDVFVQLIKGLGRYDGRARVGTWVYRIAMNVAISWLRREGRRRHASLDAPQAFVKADESRGATLGDSIPDTSQSFADGFETATTREDAHRRHDRLQDALDHLSEEHRSVLVLRDAMGLDYQQVAEALDVPVGTVKSRLFRARLALREVVERQQSPPEGANNNPLQAPESESGAPPTA